MEGGPAGMHCGCFCTPLPGMLMKMEEGIYVDVHPLKIVGDVRLGICHKACGSVNQAKGAASTPIAGRAGFSASLPVQGKEAMLP